LECGAGEEVWIGDAIRMALIGWHEDVALICIEAPKTVRVRCGANPKRLMHRARGRRLYLLKMRGGAVFHLNDMNVSAQKLVPPPGVVLLRDTRLDIDPDGEPVVRRPKRPDSSRDIAQMDEKEE
jgi:hypothetical protein